jgi:hypothetical protein
MSWLRPSPQQQNETELLRLWRRSRLQDRLENLPLEFLLHRELHRLRILEEDARAKTGCLPVRLRLKRLIAKAIRSVTSWLVKPPLKWLSRRRSLQPLRRALVQARRRLLLSLLTALVRMLRRSLGNRRP